MDQEIDNVNHPPHYTQGEIECIDAIKASMNEQEYVGFLKGQVEKYLWRFEKKWNPLEDIRKAGFYLDKLEKFMMENPSIFAERNLTVTMPPLDEGLMKTLAQ